MSAQKAAPKGRIDTDTYTLILVAARNVMILSRCCQAELRGAEKAVSEAMDGRGQKVESSLPCFELDLMISHPSYFLVPL